MAKVRSTNSSGPTRKVRPALTPEARENQMIALAMDLVERRLIEGTASSQETTHFLKLATAKAKLENQILEAERELKTAKTESIRSEKKIEELYSNAISAMKHYGGHDDDDY